MVHQQVIFTRNKVNKVRIFHLIIILIILSKFSKMINSTPILIKYHQSNQNNHLDKMKLAYLNQLSHLIHYH